MTLTSIHQPPDAGPTLLAERELAARWRKSLRTLQRWRAEGYGPAHLRIGGSILYRLEDILAFEVQVCRGGEARQ